MMKRRRLKIKVSKFLCDKRARSKDSEDAFGRSLRQFWGFGNSVTFNPAVKLPKLQLKEFSGDPLEWRSFWDSFEASVHLSTKISDVDKMNYLKGFLRGDASRAMKDYR